MNHIITRKRLEGLRVIEELEQKRQKRYTSNREILNKIEKIVEENKDLRFCQILYILGIMTTENIDKFNEESIDTLENLEFPETV